MILARIRSQFGKLARVVWFARWLDLPTGGLARGRVPVEEKAEKLKDSMCTSKCSGWGEERIGDASVSPVLVRLCARDAGGACCVPSAMPHRLNSDSIASTKYSKGDEHVKSWISKTS
jgi:hypothetical protein